MLLIQCSYFYCYLFIFNICYHANYIVPKSVSLCTVWVFNIDWCHYLISSVLDMFSGRPTSRALKLDGIPTLCANKSLSVTWSVRSLSQRRNVEPSISRIAVSQVHLKKIKHENMWTKYSMRYNKTIMLENVTCTLNRDKRSNN